MEEVFEVIILHSDGDYVYFRKDGREWGIPVFPRIRGATRGMRIRINWLQPNTETPFPKLLSWPYGSFLGAELVADSQ